MCPPPPRAAEGSPGSGRGLPKSRGVWGHLGEAGHPGTAAQRARRPWLFPKPHPLPPSIRFGVATASGKARAPVGSSRGEEGLWLLGPPPSVEGRAAARPAGPRGPGGGRGAGAGGPHGARGNLVLSAGTRVSVALARILAAAAAAAAASFPGKLGKSVHL